MDYYRNIKISFQIWNIENEIKKGIFKKNVHWRNTFTDRLWAVIEGECGLKKMSCG